MKSLLNVLTNDQEVKTKVYDELHNARGIDFIWENLDTQEREQRKFAIRTVLSTQYLRDYPESVLKSANTLVTALQTRRYPRTEG